MRAGRQACLPELKPVREQAGLLILVYSELGCCSDELPKSEKSAHICTVVLLTHQHAM